jgi:hypothetical protein
VRTYGDLTRDLAHPLYTRLHRSPASAQQSGTSVFGTSASARRLTSSFPRSSGRGRGRGAPRSTTGNVPTCTAATAAWTMSCCFPNTRTPTPPRTSSPGCPWRPRRCCSARWTARVRGAAHRPTSGHQRGDPEPDVETVQQGQLRVGARARDPRPPSCPRTTRCSQHRPRRQVLVQALVCWSGRSTAARGRPCRGSASPACCCAGRGLQCGQISSRRRITVR